MAIGEARGSIFLDVAQARGAVSSLTGDLRTLSSRGAGGLDDLADSVIRNEQHITALGQSLVVGGAALTGFFVSGLKVAADFEVGMNRVAALSGATAEEFGALKNLALDLSQTTRYTATEIADAMGFLAMAGFDVNEIMAALPGTLSLAAAAQMDLGRAADLSTNILTSFGMEASELDSVVDMLVQTFTNSNTSMEQLGDAFKYVGPVAMAAGLTFEETAALLGMLGDAGIQGSMAGTTLRGAITRLINPTASVQKNLDALGVSVTDANGQMLPMVDILAQFPPVTAASADAMLELQAAADAAGIALEDAEGNARPMEDVLADMEAAGIDTSAMLDALGGDAETVGMIMEIFGLRAGPGMVSLLAQGTDKLEEFTALIADSGGVAEEVADKQLRGLTGALNLLRAAWESLMIRAMDSGPIQAIAAFVRMLTSMVQAIGKLPGPILGTIAIITGLAGVTMTLGGVFLLLLPRIARTYQAVMLFQRWGGISRVVTTLGTSLSGLGRQAMMLPGPIGRASTAVANMLATMRADGAVNTLRSSLMRFVSMHPALVGMGLVAGAVGLAYKTNFLGIGDAIDGLISKVSSIGSAMKNAFKGAGGEAAIAEDQVASLAKATHVMDGVTVYTAFRSNADGELEAVGEIIESYANADGMTAQVLIEGDDGQYWATIDLATGEISNAEINVDGNTAPFHERVNASLAVLETAFRDAGIGWAADIVGNLQVVVAFVGEMAGRIRTLFSDLGAVFSSLGLDRFSGMFSTLATTMGTAVIVLTPLLAGLKLLAGVVLAVLSPAVLVVAAVAALAAGAVYAYQNFEPFRTVVDRVARALRNFASNQVMRFLRNMGNMFRDVADRVGDFLSNVNDAVRPLDRLRSAASAVGSFLVSAFNAARDSASTFRGIVEPIAGHFQNLIDLASSLGSAIMAALSGDWSGAWESLKRAGEDAIDVLVSGFTALPKTVYNAITAVNWGAMWDGVKSTASAAIGWVVDEISSVNWSGFLSGAWGVIQSGLRLAWDALTSLNWRDFIPDFGGWATWITHRLSSLASWGIAAFGGWATWIGHKLSSAAAWGIGAFGNWATWIGHKLGDLAAWGIDTFGGWGSWITHKLGSRSAWGIGSFGGWAKWITHKIASFGDWGIADFDGWTSFITKTLSSWADWGIETFAGWSKWISEVEWPDWLEGFKDWLAEKMPTINWPSKEEILHAITFGLLGDDGSGGDFDGGGSDGGGGSGGSSTFDFGGNVNFLLQGGLPAPPALMADIENMRGALQGLVDFNDQSWKTVATDVSAGSGSARRIADAEFSQMAASVPPHAASIRSRVSNDFRSMRGDVSSQSSSARSAATGEFSRMGSSTQSTLARMSSNVASEFGSMQRTASSESSSTNRTTTSQISSMQSTVAGHMTGMATNSAVQMALMASNANTQGKATSTALTGWTAGAIAKLAVSMASMASTVRNSGGAMQSAGQYAGSMAGAGVAAGLRSQLGAVRGAANQIVAEVDRAMRSAARIASPSKMTTWIGEMLGEGPVVGMLSKVRDVSRAADKLMDAAIPDARTQPWELGFSPLSGGSGMGRGSTQVIDNSTHTTEYIALTQSDFMQLLRKSERGNEAYRHLSDPDSYNYGGGV